MSLAMKDSAATRRLALENPIMLRLKSWKHDLGGAEQRKGSYGGLSAVGGLGAKP